MSLPLYFITEPGITAGIEVSRTQGDAFLVLDKLLGNNLFLIYFMTKYLSSRSVGVGLNRLRLLPNNESRSSCDKRTFPYPFTLLKKESHADQ